MDLGEGRGHLTYCTNIHAGEPLDEVMQSLAQYLPGIRQQVSPDQPFGVGLRLGAEATAALDSAQARERLTQFLADGGYYVFTINGFPYGPFHGAPVKAGAYEPDWSQPTRLSYTNALAHLLSELLPEGQTGSISTVPGTFKPWAEGRVDAITSNLVDHVATLIDIDQRQGKHIMLALEPEPFCFLETIDESIRYFEDELLGAHAMARLAAATGMNADQCERALRRHLGICYDVCHAAVEFEDPEQSIGALRSRGITIGKLQLSSALRVRALDNDAIDSLSEFVEPVYLHQVVQQQDGQLTRFDDLPAALAQAGSALGSQWRVHFHVPVFLAQLPRFDTTQAFLGEVLAMHRREPISQHLEVETYTWDVLPEALRQVDLGTAIARELHWVQDQLGIEAGIESAT